MLKLVQPVGGNLIKRRYFRARLTRDVRLALLDQAMHLHDGCLLIEEPVDDAPPASASLARLVPFQPCGTDTALDLPAARIAPLGLVKRPALVFADHEPSVERLHRPTLLRSSAAWVPRGYQT
jgi:hypothetical protein